MALLLGPPEGAVPDVERPSGRLAIAGIVGAVWCAALGLVTTTTLAIIGWIAAPHQSIVGGIPDVLRAAVQIWLVAHHASFSFPGGKVELLPLGLLVLPAVLLLRAGDWLSRVGRVSRLRHIPPATILLAAPYALLAGALARLVSSELLHPSLFRSLLGCFLVACLAGGVGVVRGLGWRRALALLPERVRAVAVGAGGGVAVLILAGSGLIAVALGTHLGGAASLASALHPGVVGGFLLLVLQVAYVPNAIAWGMAYAIGPGFVFGTGTTVAVSGVRLGDLPTLPMLTALPDPGSAPPASYVALAAPYAAGAVAGILTARRAPTFSAEVTALWGLTAGVCTGVVAGVLAELSSGSLGDARLATVGPVGWQVAAVGALEVGVSAAVFAWIADRVLTWRAGAAHAGTAGGVADEGGAGTEKADFNSDEAVASPGEGARLPR